MLKEDQKAQTKQLSEPYFASLKMGIQGTVEIASLRFLLIFMIPVMLVLGLFLTNYNALLLQEFQANAFHFGLLETVFAIGAIGGALFGPKLMSRYLGPGLLSIMSVFLFGMVMIAVAPLTFLREASGLLPVYGWCVVAGLAQGLYNVPLGATFLMKLPKELVGRGLSLFNAVMNLCMIIGVIVGGWLARQVGISTVLIYAGVLLVVIAVSFRMMKGYGELQKELLQQKAANRVIKEEMM